MGRVIVVEVLGKSGNVAHRVRLDGSAAVGRAYDNDVIVDDPFVDAHALHITASEDGAIVVRDLGTTNGVFASDGTRLGESVSLHAGDVLRMGRTRIRVMRADSPVPPTLADSEGRLRAMTSNRASLPSAALAFVVLWAIGSYNNSVEDFTFAVLVTELLGLLVVFGIWAGAWALGTRLAGGRARFGEHATIAVALASVSIPVGLVLSFMGFLWPNDGMTLLGVVTAIAIATVLLYAHLGVASRMPTGRRGIVGASIVLSLAGLGYLANTVDPEPEVPVQSALGTLLPIPAAWIPATDLEDFLDEAIDELASELEDAAEE
jgi:hypothetical protein